MRRGAAPLVTALLSLVVAIPLAAQQGGWRFVRVVDSAAVVDAAGERVAHPFLGGLDVPRPQLADVDGDGDLDLFVQERSGAAMFFENVGTRAEPRFAWRTDRYQDLDIGEWFRFTDLDADGLPDILAESPFSRVRYWRNVGTKAAPRFEALTDTLRRADGQPLFSDRQNIPNVTDIDCDGAPDLFIGQLTGAVDRYEQDGVDALGAPRFALLTERWEGISIIAEVTPVAPSARHGANTIAFVDVDGDGDQDLLWGDFFEPGLLLIENTGSCAEPNLRSTPVPFPRGNPVRTSGYNAPASGDLDGDGDVDFLMGVIGGAYVPNRTAVENMYHIEQVAPGRYETRSSRYLTMIDVGSESVPMLHDLDGDGDLDLLLANKIDPGDLQTSKLHWYENTGSTTAPALRERGALALTGSFHFAPAAGDLDSDGATDVVMGTWRESIAWYRLTHGPDGPSLALVDSAVAALPRGSNTIPALGDIDGDGDPDLVVGESAGNLNLFRNTGTPSAPRFTLEAERFLDVDLGRRTAPALADLDGDGDLDLLVGEEASQLVLFRNNGTRTDPRFERDHSFTVPVLGYPVPAVGDLNGDGAPDLIVGTVGGGVLQFINKGGK